MCDTGRAEVNRGNRLKLTLHQNPKQCKTETPSGTTWKRKKVQQHVSKGDDLNKDRGKGTSQTTKNNKNWNLKQGVLLVVSGHNEKTSDPGQGGHIRVSKSRRTRKGEVEEKPKKQRTSGKKKSRG